MLMANQAKKTQRDAASHPSSGRRLFSVSSALHRACPAAAQAENFQEPRVIRGSSRLRPLVLGKGCGQCPHGVGVHGRLFALHFRSFLQHLLTPVHAFTRSMRRDLEKKSVSRASWRFDWLPNWPSR